MMFDQSSVIPNICRAQRGACILDPLGAMIVDEVTPRCDICQSVSQYFKHNIKDLPCVQSHNRDVKSLEKQ